MRAGASLLLVAACSFEPGRWSTHDAASDDTHEDSGAGSDAAVPDVAAVCPSSYATMNPYRLSTTAMTWLAAEQMCEADAPGLTHLIVLDDDLERMSVAAAIQSIGDVWVGIVRDPGGQAPWSWRYVTGEAAMYAPWEGSEPNDLSGNQYVAVLRQSSMFLYDYGIDQQLAAVCECDFKPPRNADYDPATL